MKLFITMVTGLIVAFSALIPLQARIAAWRGEASPEDEILYIPHGRYLKTAVLGYDSVVADGLWLRGISLFGEKYRRDSDEGWYAFLERIVEVASDLDPLDHRIYLYGGIMLQLHPDYEEVATQIFLKGTERVDHYFLPFAVAINAIDKHNDFETAIKYLKIAADRPDAPFYLRNLTATLLNKSRQGEAAVVFLQEQLKYLPQDSLEYQAVQEKIRDLRYDLTRARLEEARSRFQAAFGRDPDGLEELLGSVVKAPSLPSDPYGGQWVVDTKTGQVVSTRLPEKRRAELDEQGDETRAASTHGAPDAGTPSHEPEAEH